MAHRVLTETAVSIWEHTKNPMATEAASEGMAVAVLNRNESALYCVPAKAYGELMDLVDDLQLGRPVWMPAWRTATGRCGSTWRTYERALIPKPCGSGGP